MKRIVSLLLIVVLLCACGGAKTQNDADAKKEYGTDFVQRAADAWNKAGYLDDMARYSDEDLLDYYGIDVAACKCAAGYRDADGYTNEAVVVVADEAAAKEIETLLSEHIASVKETFRSYDPEAYRIAEKAILERDGGLVVMIVSPDAQAMLETLRGVTP